MVRAVLALTFTPTKREVCGLPWRQLVPGSTPGLANMWSEDVDKRQKQLEISRAIHPKKESKEEKIKKIKKLIDEIAEEEYKPDHRDFR